MQIRCSSLDALVACPPSVLSPGARIDNAGGDKTAAEIGNAVHSLCASLIETDAFDVKAECARRGLDEHAETVADLMNSAVRAWGEIGPAFVVPRTEIELSADLGGNLSLTGTCDALSPLDDEASAVFLDWKTGFLDEGYHNQMYGYAYTIWRTLGRPDTGVIYGNVAFLRHRYWRTAKYTPTALAAWESNLLHNVLSPAGASRYQPGKHCVRCGLYTTCAARIELVSGTIQALALPATVREDDAHRKLLTHASRMLAGLTPENKDDPLLGLALSELIFRIRLAEAAIKDTKNLIRSAVERVGALPTAEGFQLELRDTEVRRLVPAAALPVLHRLIGERATLEAMKLSLPSALEAAAAKHSKGSKSAARRQLEDALLEAGAVEIINQQRLEETEIADEELCPSPLAGEPITLDQQRAEKRGRKRKAERGGGVPAGDSRTDGTNNGTGEGDRPAGD